MRKELLNNRTFASPKAAQRALDAWVASYNSERPHQGIGDVPPIRRFELAAPGSLEVVEEEEVKQKLPGVMRRVDKAGRISILEHRYHVGRHLAGQSVRVESKDALLHISHNGAEVATHARRHRREDDERMDRRASATKPARPTRGDEVMRKVDGSGAVSFAGVGAGTSAPRSGPVPRTAFQVSAGLPSPVLPYLGPSLVESLLHQR